jgi:hypothetical protein
MCPVQLQAYLVIFGLFNGIFERKVEKQWKNNIAM